MGSAIAVTTEYLINPPNAGVGGQKGAWATVIAATEFDARALLVQIIGPLIAELSLFDVGIGPAGAEVVLVADIGNIPMAGEESGNQSFIVPMVIPAGARLSTRVQWAGTTASTCGVGLKILGPTVRTSEPGLSRAVTYGAIPASTNVVRLTAASIGVKGSWIEITPATTAPMRHMVVLITLAEFVTSNQAWLLDIGIGSAGSEIVLVPDLVGFNSNFISAARPCVFSFPCYLPAGTRLSARVKLSATQLAGDIGIQIIGVG
jgi:hypothetical protein